MIEGVVIAEDSAVGDVGVVVEDDSVPMPVVSPVVPAPAIAAKEANAKTEAKRNSRLGKVQSRIPIPARPYSQGFAVDETGIVCRHVNDLKNSQIDQNSLHM